jgi:hypothetical protein
MPSLHKSAQVCTSLQVEIEHESQTPQLAFRSYSRLGAAPNPSPFPIDTFNEIACSCFSVGSQLRRCGASYPAGCYLPLEPRPQNFAPPRSVRLALFLLHEAWRALNLDPGDAGIHNRNLLARKSLPSVLRSRNSSDRGFLLMS